MITMESITLLRTKIMKSIERPEFLIDPKVKSSKKDRTWELTHDILYHFLDGVSKNVSGRGRIKFTCDLISELSDSLYDLLNDKDLTYLWLHIGSLVEEWIEWSVDLDEFESAENLKNILQSNY